MVTIFLWSLAFVLTRLALRHFSVYSLGFLRYLAASLTLLPMALAAGILDWMDSPQKAQALGERFMTLHHELRRDTAQLATDAIEKVLAR